MTAHFFHTVILMNRIPALLSKTKLMRGYRCLKCIYLTIHHPELEAPISPETQALFDQGNQVGKLARDYFPGGILIDNLPWDFSGALTKTRDAIANGATTIYEAAFEYTGCYARADIIQYSPENKRWRIIEVKSSTKVKPEQIEDVGLQTWIMAKSGLPIEQINLMHLNSACRYPDLDQLFTVQDVTNEIRENYLSVKPKVAEILSSIQNKNIPDIDIGPYCLEPTECGFVEHCWKQIPEMSIFNMPGMHTRKWDLYHDGIIQLDDPRLTDLNELQQRIVTAYQTKERFIDAAGIQSALSTWQFPLVFLDFETINPAIPRYDGCGPFHQVPFQFSVHRWDHPEAEITHHEFLNETMDDPRIRLIPALLDACEGTGSIVAYFSKFESARIEELAAYSPKHKDSLHQLIERMVDPLPIIRQHVYDNAFEGSFSLKKVAPALLGNAFAYDHMLVADGGAAQRAYEEFTSPNIASKRKDTLKKAMLDYCKQDTFVLVLLVKWLYEQALR